MGKRIIVGCDGTWLNSDDGFEQKSYAPWANEQEGQKVTPSNVTRICRALEPCPPDAPEKAGKTPSGALQIVNYEPGIASANNWWDHFINGGTAMSIGENVCSGYRAIVEKWQPGDEIYIFGFSRGAFIARSIAAMIRFVGLLNKQGMEYFYDVFEDWENQNIQGYKQHRYPGKRFDDETENDWSSYAMQLQKDKLTRLGVRIKAIGVWDTVGSLGVPTLGWRKPTRSYAFVNTQVLSNVDMCFHALALDEHRKPFSPTLWELPPDRIPGPNTTNPCLLRQCWFPGVHSNIGGSTADAELPDVTLAWMISQLTPYLDFDDEYLNFLEGVNNAYYASHGYERRKWGMGHISNSYTGITMLGDSKARTPGRFYRTDPKTAMPMNERLVNTNEVVHPSVRIRRWDRKEGKGTDDKGSYEPLGLKGFTLTGDGEDGDPASEGWRWTMQDPLTGKLVELKEEKLGGVERMLLGVEDGSGPSGPIGQDAHPDINGKVNSVNGRVRL